MNTELAFKIQDGMTASESGIACKAAAKHEAELKIQNLSAVSL